MTFHDLKSKWAHIEIEGKIYFDIESNADDAPTDLYFEYLTDMWNCSDLARQICEIVNA
jgi:hypothetical protein